jgi:hypothetical protein
MLHCEKLPTIHVLFPPSSPLSPSALPSESHPFPPLFLQRTQVSPVPLSFSWAPAQTHTDASYGKEAAFLCGQAVCLQLNPRGTVRHSEVDEPLVAMEGRVCVLGWKVLPVYLGNAVRS